MVADRELIDSSSSFNVQRASTNRKGNAHDNRKKDPESAGHRRPRGRHRALATASPAAAQQGAPAPGTFLGAVLVSDDAPAASAFYADLFGWDMEQAKDGGYAVWHKGRMIAGISPLKESNEDVEESFWLVGVMVKDVDASVQAATAATPRSTKTRSARQRLRSISPSSQIDRRRRFCSSNPASNRSVAPKDTDPGCGRSCGPNDIDDAAAFYADVVGVDHETTDRGGELYHLL